MGARATRRTAAVASGTLAALGVIGCGSEPEPGLAWVDGVAVFRADSDGGMDALFTGHLRREGQCLVLDAGGSVLDTPIWPLDVEIEVEDGAVVVDGHREGAEVRLGGGVAGDAQDRAYGGLIGLAQQLCDGRDAWIVAP